MSDWTCLHPAEFFLLWWAMDLGEPPVALGLPRPGATPHERDRHADEASAALSARGLGTVRAPATPVATAMRHLAGATTTLDLHVYGADGANVRHGVGAGSAVAVRTGDEVRLATVTPDRIAASLLGTLAPLPAGPGLPANVDLDDYLAACRAGEETGLPGFATALGAAGLRPADVATVVRAVTARAGGGQLGATHTGRRAPSPVTWVDTPAGRYAVRRHDDWVTVTPVDARRLALMAAEL